MKRCSFSKYHLTACILLVILLILSTVAFAEDKPLAGRTISIMGDSISTYHGWSDAWPIADETCTYRYGEAYYGPAGSDFHNTSLLVTDTWWHQAATELGAEILMSNASNSTGLLYPRNNTPEWYQWTSELLAYKSRPYYLGKNGISPDVIALYIGSNEISMLDKVNEYGSVNNVNFDTLIRPDGNGGYIYQEPVTVADAYCILLHKISVTYPDAEVYCFACVPNSSAGKVEILNKRFKAAQAFNEMVRGVAKHYGAIMVELVDAFELDPDGDGTVTADAVAAFASCYNGDPHPNALGFDVISDCFVKAVRENSKYNAVQVETLAGVMESVPVTVQSNTAGGVTTTLQTSGQVLTPRNMSVDYQSQKVTSANGNAEFRDHYTSSSNHYHAEGGCEKVCVNTAPELKLSIPLTAVDDPATPQNETKGEAKGDGGIHRSPAQGDLKEGLTDGTYNYTLSAASNTGAMTIQTKEIQFSRFNSNSETDMKFVVNRTRPNKDNHMILHMIPISDSKVVQHPNGPQDVPTISDGYEYVYIGSDQYSHFYAAFQYTDPEMDYTGQGPLYYADGEGLYLDVAKSVFVDRNLTVPSLHLASGKVSSTDSEEYPGPFPARYDSIQQFYLSDKNGNVATTYCADQTQPAYKGFSYNIQNLEDSSYYSKDAARKLRAAALHGYWGTPTPSEYDSLENLKAMMRESGKFTQEDIDMLTDGIAMTATQYAIWTFSNEMDNHKYTSAYWQDDAGDYSMQQADEKYVDLIFKLYFHLISLMSETTDPEDADTTNTVINEQNFIEDIEVQLLRKADHQNNLDSNDANDIYEANVSFRLKVKPVGHQHDRQIDSLLMTLTTPNGVVKGRITGELQKDELQLYPGENGTYTIRGVKLSEGMENICFSLNGYQTLDKDVYLYTSESKYIDEETGISPSQAMVGIAEGVSDIGVKMQISFDLDVKDNVSCQEHVWRWEKWLPVSPESLPRTGDSSKPVLWMMLSGTASLLMAALFFQRRKYMP